MLYERWSAVAARHATEVAIHDPFQQRQWTFAELAESAERHPPSSDPVVLARGHDAGFFVTILAAWRDGIPLLPLEQDQAPPEIRDLPERTAHLKMTSGTTGKPRLIAFTEDQLAADAVHILPTMRLDRATPNLAVISLAHSYGFSNLVTPLLLHGHPVILCPTPLPAMVRKAAEGFVQIALPAVPAMWRAWHDAGAVPRNVVTAISAGAPLPIELERAVFDVTGIKIHNFCGASECGGIAYDRSSTPRTDPTLIGEPMDGVTLTVNHDGCLVVQSAAVGLGHVEDAGDEPMGDAIFVTSDLAQLTDGQLRITGRASDVINIAGRKLTPETVEHVIRGLTGVRDCVVFGIPSCKGARGEEAVVALELEDGADLDAVRRTAAPLLSDWQRPRHWSVVSGIQSNARGKISRARWRDAFLKEHSGSS